MKIGIFDRVMSGIMVCMAAFALAVACTPQSDAAEVEKPVVETVKEVAQKVSLKETAEGLLVKLIDAATTAADFVADEIPKVIKELLLYNTAYHAAWVIMALFMLLWDWLGWWSWAKKYQDDSDGFSYVPVILIAGIFGAVFFYHTFELMKITLAPRVWLLEYAADLVR